MAMNMDAVLRIVAKVEGDNALQKLGASLAGIGDKAGKTLSPLGQMRGAMRGIADVAATMGLAAAGQQLATAGIEAVSVTTRIKSLAGAYGEIQGVTDVATRAAKEFALGNVVAQGAVADLYGRLRPAGVSLKEIETVFFGVNKAAKTLGLSTEDVNGVMLQLSQALGSGKLQGDELRSIMERMPAVGQAVANVMGLTVGEVKELGSQGKITTDVMIRAAEELKKMQAPPPTSIQQFEKALADLRSTLGEQLLPILTPFVQGLTGLLNAFTGLPGWVQTGVVAFGVLAIAMGPIASTITAIGNALIVLGGLKIGATIAGWLGVVGPAVAGMTAAFSGFLAFLTGTFLPAVLASFSGPAGWTVLAVAAVVAMAVAFRKPITDFLTWLGTAITEGFTAAWEGAKEIVAAFPEWFSTNVTQPLQAGWRALVEFIPRAMQAAANNVVSIWINVVTAVKNVVNSIMRVIQNGINAGINAVNFLIRTVNRVSPVQISTIGQVSLPQFAQGGYVTRPTIAQIAEGGEPEYVVPRSKAAAFANNIASGRTGAQAIPAGRGGAVFTAQPTEPSPATPSGASVRIQIQTGPVMEMNGQRWVSYDDLERAMRQTADSVMAAQRRPATRLALGRM